MAKIQLEPPNASPTKHYRKLDHGDIWHRSNPMVPIFSGESIESTEWTPRYKERRCSSSPCAQNSKFTRRVQSKIRQAKNTVLLSMEIGWKCEASKALNWDNAKVSWRGCRKKTCWKNMVYFAFMTNFKAIASIWRYEETLLLGGSGQFKRYWALHRIVRHQMEMFDIKWILFVYRVTSSDSGILSPYLWLPPRK